MFTFILRRILEMIPVLFILITVTFFMIRLVPGGPFDQERQFDPVVEESIGAFYGLNDPLSLQYWNYIKQLLHGNLGPSLQHSGFSVQEILIEKIPTSLELGIYATILALGIGIPLGLIAASKRNTWRDHLAISITMLGISLPAFVIGPLLILFFSLKLKWLSVSGWENWQDKVLPSIALSSIYIAYIARLMRSSMLETMQKDYMRTAFAKGLSNWEVYLKHGLRNALHPVIAYLGPSLAGMLCGTFVVETVFHIPGIGRFFTMAAFNRDYTMILGTVLFFALSLMLFNLMIDIMLINLNPRAKFQK